MADSSSPQMVWENFYFPSFLLYMSVTILSVLTTDCTQTELVPAAKALPSIESHKQFQSAEWWMTAQRGDAEILRLMTNACEKTSGQVWENKTITEIRESCWQFFWHLEPISKHEKPYCYWLFFCVSSSSCHSHDLPAMVKKETWK